ncbi:MAG: hypothetical protein AAFP19_15715 [Bacteroidota bacterium]
MQQVQGTLKESYTDEHSYVWRTLNEQQKKINEISAANAYIECYDRLSLDSPRIVYLDALNKSLEALSGWRTVLVPGLVPTKDFFQHLLKKEYPITVFIRGIDELKHSESPDKFHDIYGHVPLLVDPKFNQFLFDFSLMALKFIDNEELVKYLGNFYWYTFEMGLIREQGTYKAYGGAILTSMSETKNIDNPSVEKLRFDVRDMLLREIDIANLQSQYFYIESFDELFNSLDQIEQVLNELAAPVYDERRIQAA